MEVVWGLEDDPFSPVHRPLWVLHVHMCVLHVYVIHSLLVSVCVVI